MKVYLIEYGRKAEKQLAAILDRRLSLQLKSAIGSLATAPRPPGVVKMAGMKDHWRIRVGEWRVVYRVEDSRLVVVGIAVGGRGGVAALGG